MRSTVKIKFDKSWLLFIAAATVFLAIKIPASDYAVSDENTYYKMGQLVAGGQVPYRDFFFSHLPLQVYLYAAVFKLFGFNLIILKLLSAAAVAVTAAFVFAIAKSRIGPAIASAATLLFMFSYGTLLFSNYPTGLELAMPFVMAAFYFFLQKKSLLCGFMLGLATATYQLSVLALPVFLLGAALMLKEKKALLRMAVGFAAVAGAVSLIFLLAAGWEFIRQVLVYHLQKPSENIDKSAIFFRILKTNWLLFGLAALAVASSHRKKITLLMPLSIALVYVLAFPFIKTAFNYYLLYAFPFLALTGGYGLLALQELLTGKIKLRRGLAAAAIIALIALSSFFAARQFYDYDFQDFDNAQEIAGYVQANSRQEQTIFGDDSTVPLISILAGREIALNYADNNAMRYRSGITGMEATLRQLNESAGKGELKFILLRRIKLDEGTLDFGIGTEDKFTAFVKGNCILAKEFSAEWRGLTHAYYVYDCLKT